MGSNCDRGRCAETSETPRRISTAPEPPEPSVIRAYESGVGGFGILEKRYGGPCCATCGGMAWLTFLTGPLYASFGPTLVLLATPFLRPLSPSWAEAFDRACIFLVKSPPAMRNARLDKEGAHKYACPDGKDEETGEVAETELSSTVPAGVKVAAPATTVRTISVSVPEGAGPGTVLNVQSPDGIKIEVQVPEGAAAGSSFQVQYNSPGTSDLVGSSETEEGLLTSMIKVSPYSS